MNHEVWKKQNSPRGGFTLLETLISLGLFSIILGTGFAAAFLVIDGSYRAGWAVDVAEEGDFVTKKFQFLLDDAASVQTPLPGATGPTLTFVTNGGESITVGLAGDQVSMTRGAGAPALLSGAQVHADSLAFEHTAKTATQPEAIVMRLGLNGKAVESSYFFPSQQ